MASISSPLPPCGGTEDLHGSTCCTSPFRSRHGALHSPFHRPVRDVTISHLERGAGKDRIPVRRASPSHRFKVFAEPHNRRKLYVPPESTLETTCAEEMLEQLLNQMGLATSQEDYVEAACIRDTISMLLEREPVLNLKLAIEKAVAEERFEDAAKYRDQLKLLARPSSPELDCYSDTTTQGIRVQVRSAYVNDRSQPYKRQYFFAYRIRISNICSRPVQLLSRHWVITDANGKTERIRGVGVIGEQPVLLPGSNFEYTSACPLCTATGKMEGDFEMRYLDEAAYSTFNVKVGTFALAMQPTVIAE